MPPETAPTSRAGLGGRDRRIATRFVEASFPPGERLPAADPERLMASVDAWLEASRALRGGLASLLWWLEIRHLVRHGSRFSNASVGARGDFLRHIASTRVSGWCLRALSAPFRAAYLLDDENLDRLGTRGSVPVPGSVDAPRWREQVLAPERALETPEIECDVVVIGTGAGGAAAAYELSGRGLAVVMLEEGRHHDRSEFTGRLAEVIPKLYRSPGFVPALGGSVIPIPIGRSVGGTTTINSGTCLRAPDRTLERWRADGLADFGAADLAPYFEEVEKILRVQPADPGAVGEVGRLIAAGAERLGFREMGPLLRNAEGCDGQALCQFGCPTDAKQSTLVSFVPRALERGAFLFTGLRAEMLLREAGRIAGVVARGRGANAEALTLTVRARATVVAMGTLLSPVFLAENGVAGRWLGRNLSIHPAGAVTGHFPGRDLGNGRSIPQGFGIHDLADDGIRFEGGTVPPVAHGLMTPFQGEEFVRFVERWPSTAYFGFMIEDTARGRVRRGVSRDVPLVLYRMNDTDFARFRRGIDSLARIQLAAGAEEVGIPGPGRTTIVRNHRDLEAFWASRPRPRHFLVTAYHPLGTARISARADAGVCDAEHRVRSEEGLYVMDGSSVPTALGVNPQVTIMALAMRAARRLAERLSG
ncbi:putative GMC-type oxidoreductase [Myxococcaceae bacterium]|nr:putative GMC-type oxidoreductase [Myxococcaceae bacterium]